MKCETGLTVTTLLFNAKLCSTILLEITDVPSTISDFLPNKVNQNMRNYVCHSFGNVMKNMRVETGISQEKLSELADISCDYTSKLEAGKRQPSLETLLAIAKALNVTAAAIVSRMEENNFPIENILKTKRYIKHS